MRKEEETHPRARGGVGAENLLDASRLLEQLRHRPLVIRDLPALLELLASRILERLNEHVPDMSVKGVAVRFEVESVTEDGEGGDVLELGDFGEGEGVGKHGRFEGDDGDAEGAGSEVVDEVVGRFGRERASHGVVDSSCAVESGLAERRNEEKAGRVTNRQLHR